MTKQAFIKRLQARTGITEQVAKGVTQQLITNYTATVIDELFDKGLTEIELKGALVSQMTMFDDFVKKNVLTKELAESFIKGYKESEEEVKGKVS